MTWYNNCELNMNKFYNKSTKKRNIVVFQKQIIHISLVEISKREILEMFRKYGRNWNTKHVVSYLYISNHWQKKLIS